MIQGTYYKEWSTVLGREMEFKVYGHAGVPVLALPARGGRFYDWENNGMPDAIAQLLNEGKVQLFCADAVDGEGLLNGDLPQRRRAELQEKYFVYLTAELAPRILTLNNAKKGTRIWTAGVDLGAYHAVHCRLRRPTLFAGAVGMGGIYDLTRIDQGRRELPDPLCRSGRLRGRRTGRYAGTGRSAEGSGNARTSGGLGR